MIIFITSLISSTVINSKYRADITSKDAMIASLELDMKQYHEQSLSFLKTQSNIRSYINELVNLLYARESYLPIEGVGGSGNEIALNEQTSIFQLKQVIRELNDDEAVMQQVKNYLIARRNFAESFPFIWPVPGGVPRVSSAYGVRANEEVGNVLGSRPPGGIHFHAGIDIPGEIGDPVLATADGRVVWINLDNPVYGKVLIIQHNYGFQTLYGHCDNVVVKSGEYVKRGQIIAEMGNTGASYGCHVHYEIKKDGSHIDPMDLLGMNY